MCGSYNYMAPELISGDNYDKSIDIWAIGITAYRLLSGLPTFIAKTQKDLNLKIQEGVYGIPKHCEISLNLLSIIHRCLQHDPKKRITNEDLISHIHVDGESGHEKDIILSPSPEFLKKYEYPTKDCTKTNPKIWYLMSTKNRESYSKIIAEKIKEGKENEEEEKQIYKSIMDDDQEEVFNSYERLRLEEETSKENKKDKEIISSILKKKDQKHKKKVTFICIESDQDE